MSGVGREGVPPREGTQRVSQLKIESREGQEPLGLDIEYSPDTSIGIVYASVVSFVEHNF